MSNATANITNLGTTSIDHTGWCKNTGLTCHRTLMEYVDGLAVDSLEYVRDDCRNAIRALPDAPKSGHYQDTAIYCQARLNGLKDERLNQIAAINRLF